MTASDRTRELALAAAQAAADKKAQDIVIIDVADQLVITDCFPPSGSWGRRPQTTSPR